MGLTLDEQFYLLLHKKIMDKKGSAKRQAKKYYKDKYQKNGIIPKPLLLAERGIMEGRKCSGRPRSLTAQVQDRFIQMVKNSCDHGSHGFIFITRKARTIKNYHHWLEEEFKRPVSLTALRRCVKRENLQPYLNKPDFEGDITQKYCFTPEPVFDLIQMDGCVFRYFKIKNDKGSWQKPNVIEFYDTGSRYMFVLDAYFSESSWNSVDLFRQFLLSTPFPHKKIRIRPDNARGFLNLKRAFNALNLSHSVPGGFYMEPDFAKIHAAKEKAHLESSHRSLHNFEIRIIKTYEDRIIKTEPGYSFAHGKKEKITVTFLDITLADLKNSGLIETYRHEHNNTKHYFSENGKTGSWVPSQKLADYFKEAIATLSFSSQEVKAFMKYGFKKTTATVSKKKTIRFDNQDYYVTVGADLFSSHKSTPVHISQYHDKLFIFEQASNGILLGEALAQKPYEKQTKPSGGEPEPNELEQIVSFLEQHQMAVDRPALIECYHKGLSLIMAKKVFELNQNRYSTFIKKIRQPSKRAGEAVFNAFLLDCQNHLRRVHIAPYASHGET
ncbi:MAG: integrase [Candidatus Marinimicrobia bacterium]|nr:integrase [Candidatus Neomarinimicrobiota bacterium]